jgi:hypothetical protein
MTVMSWDEWARDDATALAAEVRAGRVTPRERSSRALIQTQTLYKRSTYRP